MTGAAYAKALFELAGEQEEQNITAVGTLFQEQPEYRRMLDCGVLTAKEGDELISEAFGDTLTAAVLKMMARKRQLYMWEDFAAEMKVLLDAHRNILRAKVVTAVPLSHSLEERLIQALEKRTGKTVQLEITVDESVLGGISVQADGIYWDGTLREQLQQMQTALKGEM
ncbi:MAG: ATP synthase F1 subunit delta [Ruminococcaceae bacterium]|nr:ATP synthase F1 subunit delta [Oscillospiraceae bacterium]